MNENHSESSVAAAITDEESHPIAASPNDCGYGRIGELARREKASAAFAEVRHPAGAAESPAFSYEDEMRELEKLVISFFGSDP
jgi:hypothetical protein